MSAKSPLGERSSYQGPYSADLLHPIAREDNRRTLGLGAELPFHGEDIWNAYELSWLDDRAKPQIATAEFRVPYDSPNIIESKSMKLYLNSFSMTQYQAGEEVAETIAADLTRTAGAQVGVNLKSITETEDFGGLPGTCIDDNDVDCESKTVDSGLLECTAAEAVEEELHTHLLRSLCPVTGQPDMGSLLVRYQGRRIDPNALLRYVVSYRNHDDFHESCIERMFLDIKRQCGPEALTVYARYNRRGGIDINPFRSDFETTAANTRLWRQ